MIAFSCPACDAGLEADLEFAGQRIECPSCARPVVVPAGAIKPGTVFSGYTISRHLRSEGFAEIYEAVQPSVGRPVMLEILPPGISPDGAWPMHFLAQARRAAKVEHPGIVPVVDVGTFSSCLYVVSPIPSGDDLETRLERGGRLPVREALELALRIARILSACWDRYQLAHLDLRPANILLDDVTGVRLTDHGLSGHLVPHTGGPNSPLLSPYMSPEQLVAGTAPDCRSDIYSLGYLLHHLLTGHRPYGEATGNALSLRIAGEPLPPVHDVFPALGESIDAVVHPLMLKDAARRPASWEIVIDRLEDSIKSLGSKARTPQARANIESHSPMRIKASRVPSARPKQATEISATPWILLVLVLLAGGGGFLAWRAYQHQQATREAQALAAEEDARRAREDLERRSAEMIDSVRRYAAERPNDFTGIRARIQSAREAVAAGSSAALDALAAEVTTREAEAAAQANPRPSSNDATALATSDSGSNTQAVVTAETPKRPARERAARLLLDRKSAEALALLDTEADPAHEALKQDLRVLDQRSDALIKSLERLINIETNLVFRDGPRLVVIRSFQPPVIRIDRVARDGDRVAGRAPGSFRVDELAPQEWIRQLSAQPSDANTILCGLIAYEAGALSDARAWFNRSNSPWSPLLVAALDAEFAPTL